MLFGLSKRMQKAHLVFGSPSSYNCAEVVLSSFLIGEIKRFEYSLRLSALKQGCCFPVSDTFSWVGC